MAEVQKDAQGSREDTLRFLDMVGLFGTQAMMALGKLANPATGKAEPHLEVARVFIDMLEMIERKTRGNLNADEAKLLQSTLTDLRLMFIEESKAPASAPTPPAAAEQPPAEPKPAEPPAADDKVKYHKSYGDQP